VQETPIWRRPEQPHTHSYRSVFGILTIRRHNYGNREDQKLEVASSGCGRRWLPTRTADREPGRLL
jgi:hypothetical protein